jgi:hypothetical protein
MFKKGKRQNKLRQMSKIIYELSSIKVGFRRARREKALNRKAFLINKTAHSENQQESIHCHGFFVKYKNLFSLLFFFLIAFAERLLSVQENCII